jgi:hypothetical protein
VLAALGSAGFQGSIKVCRFGSLPCHLYLLIAVVVSEVLYHARTMKSYGVFQVSQASFTPCAEANFTIVGHLPIRRCSDSPMILSTILMPLLGVCSIRTWGTVSFSVRPVFETQFFSKDGYFTSQRMSVWS